MAAGHDIKLKRPDLPVLVIALVSLTVATMLLSGVANKTYKLVTYKVHKESAFIAFAAFVIYLFIIQTRKQPFSTAGAAMFAGSGYIGHILMDISGINTLFF